MSNAPTTETEFKALDAAVMMPCGEPCCQEFAKYGVHSHAINGTDTAVKDSNPKDGIGETKLPLYLVPATAIAMYSLAHLNGGLKYGFWNWRKAGIRLSVYLNALRRHISAYENGEEVDPDDGVPHLAAMGACLNIIIDAGAAGKLVDDRPPRIDIRGWFNRLTPTVTSLKKLHAKRSPRHWTIADSETCACGLRRGVPGHGEIACGNILQPLDPNAPRSK